MNTAFLHKGIGLRRVPKTDTPAGKQVGWSVEHKYMKQFNWFNILLAVVSKKWFYSSSLNWPTGLTKNISIIIYLFYSPPCPPSKNVLKSTNRSKEKGNKLLFFWYWWYYWWYYQHLSRDSVSPVCRIFFLFTRLELLCKKFGHDWCFF